MNAKKRVTLLGSTGSIGKSTLQVIKHLQDTIEIVALAAKSNIDLLEEQIKTFKPKYAAVFDKEQALILQKRGLDCTILAGMEGLIEIVTASDVDFVVAAMVGAAGLIPTIEAIKAGKAIGLANKEVLVSAGELVMRLVKEHKTTLLPIDSEHSALFQCLHNEKRQSIARLLVTASGGPFRLHSLEQMQKIALEDALKHPTWQMGAKITIDSSTLMNKGLEVIEARWLFDVPAKQINVIVHPQSIIHSMVEFVDGSILAQMNMPNMINPIQYALTYPDRLPGLLPPFDFTKMHHLDFVPPDMQKFPCLRLAIESLEAGGSFACYMNAANETLVNRFLNKEISWYAIGQKLEVLMRRHRVEKELSLERILAIDHEARAEAKRN